MNDRAKENRFLDALEALFTGAEVEGESGFINLMRMKRGYFKSLRPKLMEKIDSRAEKDTAFREELFDKLYTFFSRYFCESGSIYFRHLPAFSKIYERVYSSDEDVALSWKTRMLYYVKSDILVRSMPVKLEDKQKPAHKKLFYFDASQVEHKRNNERREFVFEFAKVEKSPEGNVVHLSVSYSQKGRKTKLETIIRKARNVPGAKVMLSEDDLQDAFRVFKRQTEADFFINKDARGFLREQFDLWLYQYIFQEETIFEQKRLSQLQAVQQTAYDIIDFIAQFEDELRRVWEKPKFVRNVNYVVTLDKLPPGLLDKIVRHKGAAAQVEEWQSLELVDEQFSIAELNKGDGELGLESNGPVNRACRFLPLDTKHFKELEMEILDALGDLDEALDGELVHSENWQALNTLQKRYRGRVKCIYIDPPFNLGDSDQFDYRTNYKDSCWLTLLENRIGLARQFLTENGSIFVRCGHDGNHLVRSVLNLIFGEDNYRNEIVVRRAEEQKGELMKQFESMRAMMVNYDNLYWYSLNPSTRFDFITRPSNEQQAQSQWHSFWKAENRHHLRYELLGVDLTKHGRGQWMWSKERACRAVENYREYLLSYKKTKQPLEVYWRRKAENYKRKTSYEMEFIRKERNGSGISSVKYWMPPRDFVISDNNWMDIKGYANTTEFNTENSEVLLDRIIRHLATEDNTTCVLDFFSGSGTTQAVAQKLERKWIGVEMGEHFHTVILPRMKKVVSGHQSGISKSKEITYTGGGAFKYYTLEQYEETLRNSRYQDGEQLELDSMKSPFEQYVFFGDDKLAHAAQMLKNGDLEINIQDLYPDIDIAESLSNVLGKPIRRLSADTVTFTDGTTEKTNPATMTEEEKRHFISLIKPYLWWGTL